MKRGHLNLFYYGPLIAWMIFIFMMSTGIGKDENSKALITGILQTLAPDLVSTFTVDQLHFLDYVLRKLGHVTEYFVLFCLAVRAFQYGRLQLRWQSLVGGLGLCAAYAVTDEAHQYFVAGRTGSAVDVLIDFGGAVAGLIAILAWFGVKRTERALWRKADSEIADAAHGIGPPPPNPGGASCKLGGSTANAGGELS